MFTDKLYSRKKRFKVVEYLKEINFKLYRSNSFMDREMIGIMIIDATLAGSGKEPRQIIVNGRYSVEEQRFAIGYLIAKYREEFDECRDYRYCSTYNITDTEYNDKALDILDPKNRLIKEYKRVYRRNRSMSMAIVEISKYFGIPARVIIKLIQ